MKVSQEPVATAGIATMLAALIVAVGNATGWWTLDTTTATSVAVAVIGVLAFVTSLLARRKVTPVAIPVPPAAPPPAG